VQLATDVAEPADQFLLDVHVDVFQLHMVLESPLFDLQTNGLQSRFDQPSLGFRNQAHRRQHLGMGNRSGNILRVQPLIKADAFGKAFDAAIRRLLKHSASAGAGQRSSSCIDHRGDNNPFMLCSLRTAVNERATLVPKFWAPRAKRILDLIGKSDASCVVPPDDKANIVDTD